MNRYLRQEIFSEIGKQGQERLRKSRVVILGVGALGSVCAELLARAGIGHITLIDRDIVSLDNLQRQGLYCEVDVGKPKAEQARKRLCEINSDITIIAHVENVTADNIHMFIQGDLVIDGTDNLETRYLLDDYCHKSNIPWIYAGAIQDRGMIAIIFPQQLTLMDMIPRGHSNETCDTVGVLNTATQIIGSFQAMEGLKILLGKTKKPVLYHVNVWDATIEHIDLHLVKKQEKRVYSSLEGHTKKNMVHYCGSNRYQFTVPHFDFIETKKRFQQLGKIHEFETGFCFETIIVFQRGRVLLEAKDEIEAKRIYQKYFGD